MKLASISSLLFTLTGMSVCHAAVNEIPVVTLNIGTGGWYPVTYVSILGGSSHVPVLLDTGSQTIALCNTTDPGDMANAVDLYACENYGGYPEEPNGWNGIFYNMSLSFGDGKEIVTDPSYVKAAVMESGVDSLCNADIQGIVGVNLFPTQAYDEPQLVPAPGNCEYFQNGSGNCCPGNKTNFDSQFADTMLTEANLYTYGFIGLSSDIDTPGNTSVMAFGARARERVLEENSVGTTSFSTSNIGLNWFTFNDDVVFSFTGLDTDNCTEIPGLDANCEAIIPHSDDPSKQVILDSGTPTLAVPIGNCTDFAKALDPNTTLMTITIGEVQLEVTGGDLEKYWYMFVLQCAGVSQATLGLPIFWLYDIIFDVSPQKFEEDLEVVNPSLATKTVTSQSSLPSYGDATFYRRSSDASTSSATGASVAKHPNDVFPSSAAEKDGTDKDASTKEDNAPALDEVLAASAASTVITALCSTVAVGVAATFAALVV